MRKRVVVTGFPRRTHVRQLRALRLIGGLSLKYAIELARYCEGRESVALITGIEASVAGAICEALCNSGSNAFLEECDDKCPMVLTLRADTQYEWSSWRGLVKAPRAR